MFSAQGTCTRTVCKHTDMNEVACSHPASFFCMFDAVQPSCYCRRLSSCSLELGIPVTLHQGQTPCQSHRSRRRCKGRYKHLRLSVEFSAGCKTCAQVTVCNLFTSVGVFGFALACGTSCWAPAEAEQGWVAVERYLATFIRKL